MKGAITLGEACVRLSMSRSTLRRRLKEFGIPTFVHRTNRRNRYILLYDVEKLDRSEF